MAEIDWSKVQFWADVGIYEDDNGVDRYDITIYDVSSGEELSSGVEETAELAQAWIEREVELLKQQDEDTPNPDYFDRNPHLIATIH